MARYRGPKCKLMRREGTDLYLKSGARPLDAKCKLETQPGQHGTKKSRLTDYGSQFRAKQMLKRIYGLTETQFKSYYSEASRKKGSTGEVLLQFLESRLDNMVYRMGFASTRAEARQLVAHKAIQLNGKKVNIPSYLTVPGDIIEVREQKRSQLRIQQALELARQRKSVDWVDVSEANFSGTYKYIPLQSELPQEYKVQLVVELYSK